MGCRSAGGARRRFYLGEVRSRAFRGRRDHLRQRGDAGLSDDCNSFSIPGHSAYLQIARSGQALVFYASTDGSTWKILRSFSLGPAKVLKAGFSAQSPTGEGCKAACSRIRYSPKRMGNIYTGK